MRNLKMLPVALDLRLGAAGIITRREHELSPGARAARSVLREVAARMYPRRAAQGTGRGGEI